MSPEERELLTKSIKISEENNRMLKGIRRRARFSSLIHLIYWLLIIGSIVGSYYMVKPFVDPFISGYKSMQQNIQSVKNVTTNLPALPTWLGGKQ